MATIDWNKRADATPAIQGGLDGGTNHIGHGVPGFFKLSDLPTSGPAGPKLKLPAGFMPTAWSAYVLENKLKDGVSKTLTIAASNPTISGSATIAGNLDGSDSDSDADPDTATPTGRLAMGAVASPAIVTSDENYLVPKVNAIVNPASDGDALVLIVVHGDVVDRSKIYLW